MDPLKKEVFKALQAVKTGDEVIDDCNHTASQYVHGILRAHGAALEHIERNKNQYTPAGLEVQREKAAKKAQGDLQEVQGKSNWTPDIAKIEKKFDDVESESDIRVLIRESRERETRSFMRKFEGDPLLFEANFGEMIRDGDPVITGAVVHSPLPLAIDPSLAKTAKEKYRLSTNPMAADRLATLQAAQKIHDDLFRFAEVELGMGDTEITGVES